MDVNLLENYLKNQDFKNADKTTTALILASGDFENKGYLDQYDLNRLSSKDLRKIDHLWTKYSSGKFGFSVQKQIWLDFGFKLADCNDNSFTKFALRVGWYFHTARNEGIGDNSHAVLEIAVRCYSTYIFNKSAPHGHLPGGIWQKLDKQRSLNKFWTWSRKFPPIYPLLLSAAPK